MPCAMVQVAQGVPDGEHHGHRLRTPQGDQRTSNPNPYPSPSPNLDPNPNPNPDPSPNPNPNPNPNPKPKPKPNQEAKDMKAVMLRFANFLQIPGEGKKVPGARARARARVHRGP